MSPEILGILGHGWFVMAIIGIVIGMKVRYTHLQRTRVSGSAQLEVERLADAVDTLRDEVGLLRDQHLELNERVDFTERLLERPKSADAGLDSLPGQRN